MISFKLKPFTSMAAAIIAFSLTSCINDLDISPINPQVSNSFSQDEVYNKVYATLSLTGLQGPAGSDTGDVAGVDEGSASPFYRMILTVYEYPTDEVICSWTDAGIPDFFQMNWGASSLPLTGFYSRLMYDVTLCNHFLEETESLDDEKTLRQRAEVRFIRALNYYYLMDAFGNPPFTETVSLDENPSQIKRTDLFNFLETELKEIESELTEPRTGEFGQADQACAWMLLSRMYLNAEIYTGTARWSDAATYAKKVIGSAYGLADNYAELFMADNDENEETKKEIILPLRLDGTYARSYGGAQFAIASTHTAGMTPWGTSEGWGGVRARKALLMKFFKDEADVPMMADENEMTIRAGDDRALFFSGKINGVPDEEQAENDPSDDTRTLEINDPYDFKEGISIAKWSNVRSDGQPSHDATWVDTDVPLFRTAEAYLTLAEALLRNGGTQKDVLNAVNALRKRAHAEELESVTLDQILDEKAREFYFEGQRRTDLIRYGYFTGNEYLWDWKGGIQEGTAVDADYNLYPIPTSDITVNGNLEQNSGY